VKHDQLMPAGASPAHAEPADGGRNGGATSSRFDAPIRYGDIRRGFNTMRAIAALLITIGAVYGVIRGFGAAPWVLVGAPLVFVDALRRRTHGESAFPLIVVDITAVGLALLARGNAPSIEAVALAYVVTASLLLLGLRRALLTLGYTGIWAVPIVVWAPVIVGIGPTGTEQVVIESLTVTIFLAVIAQLLVSTRHALFAAAQTQREALETERRAGALKNEFVSMVSHELRTPLTSIAGFTDTLRDSWRALSIDEIDEFLSIMRRETGHLSDLVEDILVIPRLEAGHLRLEPTNLDLRDEAFTAAHPVFQGSNTEFSVSVPGGVIVQADAVRLKQVLRNLLENARKYGGDQILVEGDADGDFYVVSVCDNGPGVPEDDRERIFDHFEQLTKGDARSDQGVGLGLPIARTLVRAMGGDLWYEDRFPTGSRFRFTIRLNRSASHLRTDRAADSQVA
jgi:signal transduction histidine kinase